MIRRSLLMVLVALVLAPAAAGTALAHQQKIAITTVAHNPRTGMIEITHQVPVHDAEHALRFQGAENPDIIASPASREAFARYVTRRFLLVVKGDIITPDYVGSEITGGSLWVYQEWPSPGGNIPIRLNSQIFTDIWALQENRVNIGRGTRVETFIFRGGDPARDAVMAT